jgi:hypothetical protein
VKSSLTRHYRQTPFALNKGWAVPTEEKQDRCRDSGGPFCGLSALKTFF